MNATELAKTVTEAVKNEKADEALAEIVAKDFAALTPLEAYHFVVQVAGGLREDRKHKEGLAVFNRLLTKCPPFNEAMEKLNAAKERGELSKPA